MKRYLIRLAISSCLVLAATAAPVHATSEYTYKKNEFRIIRGGHAPNRHLSITAHGEGDGGYKDFHLYLTAEPAHARIARLAGVGPDNVLDTGPDAITAAWSPDSRHVAVFHRSDRHILEMRLYRVESRRPVLLTGPALFDAAAKQKAETSDDVELRSSHTELTWLDSKRFKLREQRLLRTSTPDLARALSVFGKRLEDALAKSQGSDKKPADWHFIEFSAEAICEPAPGNTYRILELKPGPFERSDGN